MSSTLSSIKAKKKYSSIELSKSCPFPTLMLLFKARKTISCSMQESSTISPTLSSSKGKLTPNKNPPIASKILTAFSLSKNAGKTNNKIHKFQNPKSKLLKKPLIIFLNQPITKTIKSKFQVRKPLKSQSSIYLYKTPNNMLL